MACEGLIRAYSHNYGLNASVFRFANVIGSGMSHGVIVDFIDKLVGNPRSLEILGDGKQSKSYVLVEDVIEGILVGMVEDGFNVYNIGNEDSISVDCVADLVCRCLTLDGVQKTYTGGKVGWVGDIPKVWLDCQKLRNLGWKPSKNSEEAVVEAIESLI